MPKVSIIIPAYNAMDYLPLALDSVLHQTFQDFDVLIVNDGSVDSIQDWFSESVNDSRVTLISQENKGPSEARNAGIRGSSAPYIAFLDADDLWMPDKLERQVSILDTDKEAGLVYTWVAYIDGAGMPTGRIRKNNLEGRVWHELIRHNIVECGSIALVRRSCFDTVGLFNQSLSAFEDLDMWLRIASVYPFRVVSEPLAYYRQHTASLSRNWPIMEAAFEQVLEQAFAEVTLKALGNHPNTPESLGRLKRESYALANICVGWKPIQSQHKNYREAIRFLHNAYKHDHSTLFSKEFLHLSLAVLLICLSGGQGYEKILSLLHRTRRWITQFWLGENQSPRTQPPIINPPNIQPIESGRAQIEPQQPPASDIDGNINLCAKVPGSISLSVRRYPLPGWSCGANSDGR